MTTGKTKITSSGLFNGIFEGDFFKAQPIVSESDIAALENYNNLLANNEPIEAFEQAMKNASKTAQDLANSANGAAVDINAIPKASKAAAAGMKALSVAGNMLMSMAISFAITKIIEGIQWLVTASERAAERAREAAQAASEQAEKSTEAVESLIELKTQLAEGAKSSDELTSAFKEQLKAMGYTEKEIDTLIGKYNGLSGAIDEATTKALNDAKVNANTAKVKAGESLEKTYSGSIGFGGNDDIINAGLNMNGATSYDEIQEILKSIGKSAGTGSLSSTYGAKSDSAKDIYEYYQGLLQIKKLIEEEAAETGNDKLLSSPFYNDVNNAIEKLKESAVAYGEAISRLHEADAQLELANYLKTNSINSKETFDNYINGIKNSTEYSDEYKLVLIDVANNAFPQFSNAAKTTSEKVNKMTVSLEDLNTASESIATLSRAFKELSDDGYITIQTLDDIRKATGLSEEAWKEYQSKLIAAEVGSDEFNQILSDLTYKILANKFATAELNEVTEEEIGAILRENGVIADASLLLGRLRLEKSLLNKEQIDTSSEAEEILNLANSANASAASIKKLTRAVEYLKKAEKSEASGEHRMADYYRSQAQVYLGMPVEYDKISFDHIKYTNSSSSSKSNEALDNYLKDAENRYKIHQDEIKYIQELQYAYDNLTKDEKERLDITGKINEAYRDRADNRIKDIEHQIDLVKELQGDDADVTGYYDQIQKVAHEEAERLRSMGYDDSSDEIQSLQKTWWDAQNSKLDFYNKQHENIIRDIEHARDMALEQNPDVDTTPYYKRMQDEYHKEAERLRALDSEKYKEEIQNLQLAWWDAQKEVVKAQKDDMEKSISDIEDYIKARNLYNDWDAYGDSEIKAVQRQTKIIEDAYKQRLLSYDEYIIKLEEQSQRIYSLGKSQVDKHLSNIDKYIDARNHYNDWDDFNDSEIEAIKRQCAILDEAYRLNLISLEEYTEKSAEYTQKLYSVSKENIIETISELVEDYEEMKQLESSQNSSLKTLLQSYYDVTNVIAEAQHEINKELKASQSMYEYLNEETRELLFNQEDYNALNKELLDIQFAADELQKQYEEDILGASAETIAEITSQYQMQYETMMKQYEIAKAELDVAKKRQKLDNVLAERNTRMFINGQWQWVAKTQDVINAQNELADAEIERKKQEASLEQTEAVNNLTTQINSLETDLNKVRKWWSDMQEMLNGESDEVAKALKEISNVSSPELRRVIEATDGSVGSFSTSLSESTSTLSMIINSDLGNVSIGIGGIITDLQNYSAAIQELTAKISGASVNGGSSTGSSSSMSVSDIKAQMAANSAAWHTASASEKKKLEQANQILGASIGSTYHPGTGTWTHKYADGTRYTPSGKVLMGEKGFEAFISNNGRLIPITQPTIGNIGAGGIVFNREQMANLRNLWDWSNLGKMSPLSLSSNANNQNTVIDNSIHINGLTVGEQGNEDWINGLRRYVATHK